MQPTQIPNPKLTTPDTSPKFKMTQSQESTIKSYPSSSMNSINLKNNTITQLTQPTQPIQLSQPTQPTQPTQLAPLTQLTQSIKWDGPDKITIVSINSRGTKSTNNHPHKPVQIINIIKNNNITLLQEVSELPELKSSGINSLTNNQGLAVFSVYPISLQYSSKNILVVRTQVTLTTSIILVNTHFPNGPSKQQTESLANDINQWSTSSHWAVVAGDFNLDPKRDYNRSAFNSLRGTLSKSGLIWKENKLITRHSDHEGHNSSCIDHIFTKLPDLNKILTVLPNSFSDHLTIKLTITTTTPLKGKMVKKLKSDPNQLANQLLQSPLPTDYIRFVEQVHKVDKELQSQRKQLSDAEQHLPKLNQPKWKHEFLKPWKESTKPTTVPIMSKAMEEGKNSEERQQLSLAEIKTEWQKTFKRKRFKDNKLNLLLQSIELPNYQHVDTQISELDIVESIKTANQTSSPGPDGITFKLLAQAPEHFAKPIYSIALDLFRGRVHRKLLDSRLIMLPKPNFNGNPLDLRPIAVTNSVLRIIQRAITHKLMGSLNSLMCSNQKGFIKGRNIGTCIKKLYKKIKHMDDGWVLFVDFQKAYDSIDRRALTTIMKSYQFNSSFIRLVKTTLKSSRAYIQNSDTYIRVQRGVPQGSPLSCMLFLIAIEPVLLKITQTRPSLMLEAYADDLAIVSTKKKELKQIQKITSRSAKTVGLSVNNKKSCVLPIQLNQTIKQYWNSPKVPSYKYLGVLIKPNYNEEEMYKETLNKFKNKIQTAAAFHGTLYWKTLFLKIFALPIFSYIFQFYIPSAKMCERIDNLTQNFIDPGRNMSKEVIFARPGTYLPPPYPQTAAEYCSVFTKRFKLQGNTKTLLKYNQDIAITQINTKLEKYHPLTKDRCYNLASLAYLTGPAVTIALLLNINALPFYSKLKHFDKKATNVCPVCQSGEDNPTHLFEECSVLQTLQQYADLTNDQELNTALQCTLTSAYTLSTKLSPPELKQTVALIHTIWNYRKLRKGTKVKLLPIALAANYHSNIKNIKKANIGLLATKKKLASGTILTHTTQVWNSPLPPPPLPPPPIVPQLKKKCDTLSPSSTH
jgi:hypothetical protein